MQASNTMTASNGHPLDTSDRRAIVPVMPLTPEQLAEQALDLPAESRARLADLLVESLDAAERGPIDHAWIAVARRRRDEVRAGDVKPIPAEDAFRKARDSIKR